MPVSLKKTAAASLVDADVGLFFELLETGVRSLRVVS
jgi:hypothetical protein